MSEYLEDPSVLTKDKLKGELLAHNVELPSGNPTKDAYVQLYLKNLTAQNNRNVTAAALDAFSSDEEFPAPVVSGRTRSSGRKAIRKTDKVQPDNLDVTVLKDVLINHGVDVGSILVSPHQLNEEKLQKLLGDGPAQLHTELQVNYNGNSESDRYSDKEEEVTAEPEPVPVVERLLRSQEKTPVTPRPQDPLVEKIAASDQSLNVKESDVQKEVFQKDIRSPTGIIATCRRPIKGAANRSVKPSDLWKDEKFLFSPKTSKTSSRLSPSYTESCTVHRVTSFPSSTFMPSSRPLPASSPAAVSRSIPLWIKLSVLAVVAAFLFLVYQTMETNSINPFASPFTGVVSGSTA